MSTTKPLRFSNDSEIARAVAQVVPAPASLPLPKLRLLEAHRAILAKGISTVFSVLGWSEGTLRTVPSPPTRRRARPGAAALGDNPGAELGIDATEGKVMYVVESNGRGPPHPLAEAFCAQAMSSIRVGLEAADALHRAPTGGETTEVGYELLVCGLPDRIMTGLFRRLLEAEEAPRVPFALARRPFASPFVASSALTSWLAALPASTYEGEAVRTGIVVEVEKGALSRAGVVISQFDKHVSFEEVLASGQWLALADGERSFLVLRADLRASGVVMLPKALDAFEDELVGENLELPLGAIWFQARSPQLVRLFGWSKDATFQIGHLRRGAFRLTDRLTAALPLAAILAEITPKGLKGVHALAVHLVQLAEAGHGAGLVLGAVGKEGGKRLKHPVRVDVGTAWRSFLNPDGAVLIDSDMKLTEYGVQLPHPPQKLAPNRGTRHNALAFASLTKGRIGVAISDDGSLTVFRDGAVVLSTP
jgi:hypothetical protein